MHKKIIVLFIPLFIVLSFASAFSADKFYFDKSVAVFRGSEGKNIIEIYYAFYQKSLVYTSAEASKFSGAAELEVIIVEKGSDKLLASNLYKIPSEISDTSGDSRKNKIIGQVNYEVKPADYKIILIGNDFNMPDKKDSVVIDCSVPDFTSSSAMMSDVELSTDIQKSSDTKNLFYKNTLEVTPNAGAVYGNKLSTLWYYCEIYNINTTAAAPYWVKTVITNSNNDTMYSKLKTVGKRSAAMVQHGSVVVDTLPSGGYLLNVSFIDSAGSAYLSKQNKFYVYSINAEDNSKVTSSYMKSEFSIMNDKEIEEVYDKSIYIRTGEDTKKYESLTTLDSKRRFMYEFWNQKAAITVGRASYDKVAYFKRVNEAGILFKEPYKEGWKTDRGRIYILYGNPDDIDRHSFEADVRSYDIWTYNSLEGGAMCVFYEKEVNSSIYYLLHSTIRTEMRNDDWVKDLKKFY